MSVSVTHLAAAGTETVFPMVTSSVSPTGEVLLLVSGAGPSGVTISGVSGCSLTWSQIASRTYGSSNNIEFLWKGIGTATAGAITVTFSTDPDTASYIVSDVTGHDTGVNWVVQSVTATGTSTAIAASMSAFASGTNGLFFGAAIDNSDGIAPEAGTTELAQQTRAFFSDTMTSNFRATEDASPSATAATSATWGIIAIEITEATASSAAAASSNGAGTATATGSSSASSAASSDGAGTATAVGASAATSEFSSSGEATAIAEGASTSESVMFGEGSGTAEAVGEASTEGSGAASSDGASTATAEGASIASGDMSSDGVGTATAVGSDGEDDENTDSLEAWKYIQQTWPSERRKKLIAENNALIFRMAELALPYLVSQTRH